MDADQKVIELYQQGFSPQQIAKEVFGSKNSVTRTMTILKRNPDSGYIPGTRRPNKLRKSNAKYHFDENFFDVIDTEAKAYFFGLMAADGYIKIVNGNPTAIVLELKSDDIEIVEKFRDALGDKNVPVKIRPAYKTSCEKAKVAFFSTHLARSLHEKFGPLKTFNLGRISQHVPVELHSHFVRGVLDGDGCWSYEKYRMVLSFRGTEEFLKDIQSISPQPMYLSTTEKWPSLATRTHASACRMYNWLYYKKNPTIFLQRKFDKCKSGLSKRLLKENSKYR
jgi:hypothetical protein